MAIHSWPIVFHLPWDQRFLLNLSWAPAILLQAPILSAGGYKCLWPHPVVGAGIWTHVLMAELLTC